MSSKKLIAAAMAAIMTVGTVSTVTASATEGVDTWTIDGTGAGKEKVTEAKINPYFAFNLEGMTAITSTWDTIKDGKKNDGNNYNKELSIALWEAYNKYNFKEFNGGTATLEMKGSAVEWVQAKVIVGTGTAKDIMKLADVGTVTGNPTVLVPKLKDGAEIVLIGQDGLKEGDITDQPTTVTYAIASKEVVALYDKTDSTNKGVNWAGKVVDPADTPAAATAVGANGITKVYTAANGDLVFGDSAAATTKVASKDVSGKQTVNIGKDFRDSTGNTTSPAPEAVEWGKQTATVQFTPSFDGLSNTLRLSKIDLEKSSITVDVSGTVDDKTWERYYIDGNGKSLWTITGSKDYTWVWEPAGSAPGEFGGSTAPSTGLKVLLGYNGQTGYASNAPKTFKADPNLTKDKTDYTIPRTIAWLPQSGSATTLSFGNLVPPAVLKALNDGGTITFEFNRELKGNEYFFGAMYFGYNNGTYANNISIEPTYGNGKTATVEIPAGLTYYKDEKNPWQNVGIGWNFAFETLGNALFEQVSANNNDTDKTIPTLASDPKKGVDIVKVTFAAKGASVGTTSGSTTSNGGNTSGSGNSSKPSDNPGTGVALAIAPAVLAAGAFVVVASKKRK